MKKIKILYDAHILRDGTLNNKERRGIYWVAYNLLEKFINDEKFEVTLYLNTNINSNILREIPMLKNSNIIFKNFLLGKVAGNKEIPNPKFRIEDYDCYFNVDYRTGLEDYSPIPKFYVIHDTIPMMPNIYDPEFKKCFENFYSKLPKDVNYFCVSNSARNDFIKYFKNMNPEKMEVAYISTAQKFYPDKDKEKLNKILDKFGVEKEERKKYLFNFCGLDDRRKNLLFTVKGFLKFIEKNQIDDLYFYLGGCGQDVLKERLSNQLGETFEKHKDKILTFGYIEDDDINSLLSNSLFFVCLSLYEGFGMPNLEAMEAGVPVISSNVSSIPEVVGDCGILINPLDEEEYFNALEKMYFDENFRNDCSKKGVEKAKTFDWERMYSQITKRISKELCEV